MRIVIGGPGEQQTALLRAQISQCLARRGMAAELVPASSPARLRELFVAGAFQGAIIGFGSTEGFLCARWLRETDPECRVVLMDDTERFAIQGLRLHLSDFLVRPCGSERLCKAMERLMGLD